MSNISGRVFALVLAGALLATALLLDACTAPAVLKSVLGPPVKPKPVIHEARRPAYKPYKPQKFHYDWVPPKRIDWAERLAALPKTAAGGIDWVKALDTGLIHPKPGIKKGAKNKMVFDLTLNLVPKGMPFFAATYPHKVHTQWLTCSNCHPGIFHMAQGADHITMTDVFAGKYCGRCHGPVAFSPDKSCPRCHLQMPKKAYLVPHKRIDWAKRLAALPKTAVGGIDWVKALDKGLIHPRPGIKKDAKNKMVFDLTLKLVPKGQPLFTATYSHKVHTQWLTCSNCHPAIFHMQQGADHITMADIFAGKFCGRCHGPVAFNPATACPRCHLKMGG